jgi:hypothetical protein
MATVPLILTVSPAAGVWLRSPLPRQRAGPDFSAALDHFSRAYLIAEAQVVDAVERRRPDPGSEDFPQFDGTGIDSAD